MQGTRTSPGPKTPAAPPAIAGAGGGDRLSPAEFAARFAECWRVLWCAAVAVVRDRTLAQDVVQQAAVVGLENLGSFTPGTNFVSWMIRIVKNIALNEARRRARRRTEGADPAVLDGSPGDARRQGSAGSVNDVAVVTGRGEVAAGQGEFDDALAGALEELDETARACLLMRVVLDLPYKRIALALDIPEGTAASHVHRARASMRASLKSGGGAAAERGVRA